MKRGALPSFLLALALATAQNACTAEAAPATTADGAATTSARKPNAPAVRTVNRSPDAGNRTTSQVQTVGDGAPVDKADSVIGLTRAQLRARRGPPTEMRGNDWIYTPDQPGCRDAIVSEVMTFKRNVVATVRLQRRQTGKICHTQWE